MAFLPLIAAAIVLVIVLAAWRRSIARRRLLEELRLGWGAPIERSRDMSAIASYHFALAGSDDGPSGLDDRTWADLNLDDVFLALDRTQSTVGQQALYRRLRSAPLGPHLDAFDAVATRMNDDADTRTSLQRVFSALRHKGGYDLWLLAQPGILESKAWVGAAPLATVVVAACLAIWPFWPPAIVIVAAGAAFSLMTQVVGASSLATVLGPFRQLGPLMAAGDALARVRIAGAEPILGTLATDVAALSRLRRIAAWASRDTSAAFDPAGLVLEYLNLLFLFDANALFFGARELRARRAELLRVLDTVGDVDAAIAVASFRASRSDWTRPSFRQPGERVVLEDIRHPLITAAVPNSVTLAPPHGVLVTGSNMSGKSTFLRTIGTAAVMAQTINTCLASAYAAPVFVVRTCIGRSDDLLAGKSYYVVEVESVLALVGASAALEPHLLLFDELFRGTNAVERIAAGEAVLNELVRSRNGHPTPHVVVAATHDRELVDLLQATYAAYHFTERIDADGLAFDYRLIPGPSTTRNAIALLRLCGAPETVVTHALERAAKLDEERTRRHN
jgi:hypothetical protein